MLIQIIAASFPALRTDFEQVLAHLETPKSIAVRHPETGQRSRITLDKGFFIGC